MYIPNFNMSKILLILLTKFLKINEILKKLKTIDNLNWKFNNLKFKLI